MDPDPDLGGPKTCGSGGSGSGFVSGTLVEREAQAIPDEYEGVGGEPARQVPPVLLLLLLLLRLLYDRLSVQWKQSIQNNSLKLAPKILLIHCLLSESYSIKR